MPSRAIFPWLVAGCAAMACRSGAEYCPRPLAAETPGLQGRNDTDSPPFLEIPGVGFAPVSCGEVGGRYRRRRTACWIDPEHPDDPRLVDAQLAVARHCRRHGALARNCAKLMRQVGRSCDVLSGNERPSLAGPPRVRSSLLVTLSPPEVLRDHFHASPRDTVYGGATCTADRAQRQLDYWEGLRTADGDLDFYFGGAVYREFANTVSGLSHFWQLFGACRRRTPRG